VISVEDDQRAERELMMRDWRSGWTIHAAISAIVMTALT
jgi:hypothetical protein